MQAYRNQRIEIAVTPINGIVADFVGRDKLFDMGLCITYTGATTDASVWIEGKPDHLKAVMQRHNFDVVTPMELVPFFKVRHNEEAA